MWRFPANDGQSLKQNERLAIQDLPVGHHGKRLTEGQFNNLNVLPLGVISSSKRNSVRIVILCDKEEQFLCDRSRTHI